MSTIGPSITPSIGSSSSGAGAPDFTSNLRGLWDFDGNYAYASGNTIAADGGDTALQWYVNASTTEDTPGTPGEAIRLDTQSKYLYGTNLTAQQANDEFFPSGGKDLALAIWYKPTANRSNGDTGGVWQCGRNGSSPGVTILWQDATSGTPERIIFHVYTNASQYLTSSTNLVGLTDNTLIGFSVDNTAGTARGYVQNGNGKWTNSISLNTSIAAPGTNTFAVPKIGTAYITNFSDYFHGCDVSSFGYWNEVWDEAKFDSWYNSGNGYSFGDL